ncbi:MAG: hypothetical protein WCG26_05585 [Chloroflexales bacterium]
MAKSSTRGVHREGERWAPRNVQKALRITEEDEILLETARAYVPEASSESDLAYILWKRGLILTLAKALSAGASPPTVLAEEQLATLIAQELLSVMPLLHRTGRLHLLNLVLAAAGEHPPAAPPAQASVEEFETASAEELDELADMGGVDFI